jgi:hypothetical protein
MTEHKIKGQIGQPAACMIESKASSCMGSMRAREGRSAAWASGHVGVEAKRDYGFRRADCRASGRDVVVCAAAAVIHRSCGQVCGQAVPTAPSVAPNQGPRQLACFLCIRFVLLDKDLRHCDKHMTASNAAIQLKHRLGTSPMARAHVADPR